MPSKTSSRSEQRRRRARAIGRHIAGKHRAAETYDAVCATLRAFGSSNFPPPPQRINYGCKQQPRKAAAVQASAGTLAGTDGQVATGLCVPLKPQPSHAPACHHESNCYLGSSDPYVQQLPAHHHVFSTVMPPHMTREHAWQDHHAGQVTNGPQVPYAAAAAQQQQQQQYLCNGIQSNASVYMPHYNGATNLYFQSHLQ